MILLIAIEVNNAWNCDIATTIIKNVDYCCIIHNMNKSEAIKLLDNSMLKDCGLWVYIKILP